MKVAAAAPSGSVVAAEGTLETEQSSGWSVVWGTLFVILVIGAAIGGVYFFKRAQDTATAGPS